MLSTQSIALVYTAKYLIVIPLLMVVIDFLRAPVDERHVLLKRSVLASVIAIALAKIGGALYYDPRPFAAHHFTPILAHAPDNGFPSDHTLLAFTCVFLLLGQLSISEMILTGMAAVLVAIARVHIGLHSLFRYSRQHSICSDCGRYLNTRVSQSLGAKR